MIINILKAILKDTHQKNKFIIQAQIYKKYLTPVSTANP